MSTKSRVARIIESSNNGSSLCGMLEECLAFKEEQVKNQIADKLPAKNFELEGQREIPNAAGFIDTDGSFIDIQKYGFQTHSAMATELLKKTRDSEYDNLIEFTKSGYIRFKRENKYAVIQTETYPTRPQLNAIKNAVDICNYVGVEVLQEGRYLGTLDLFRDTLDQDMRKLEVLLNKVNPPQPKL